MSKHTFKLVCTAVLTFSAASQAFGDDQTGQDAFTDGFGADADRHTLMIGIRTKF